jgi:hypothetical protein
METTQEFNNTIAKEIALKSFGELLDTILGYTSDIGYSLQTDASEFEQNFEEDLQKKNIIVTSKKIKIISKYYEKNRIDLINKIRKKYYTSA